MACVAVAHSFHGRLGPARIATRRAVRCAAAAAPPRSAGDDAHDTRAILEEARLQAGDAYAELQSLSSGQSEPVQVRAAAAWRGRSTRARRARPLPQRCRCRAARSRYLALFGCPFVS